MQKKNYFILILIFIISNISVFSEELELNKRMPIITDSDLVINIADISENVLYYPIVIDGVSLEVLAVRVFDGTIRVAFNTCMICASSGKGYFVQVGSVLVCQNCGNRYRMSQVGRESGGCNPEPIFNENQIVTDDMIIISRDFLSDHLFMFENWRE
ncbi:MAG: DUF2318 domain-containing protein [Candidatus Cloacimonetes bacterium]|nr:DUF2318 domain-containing protein [Candidatus Cloacimonadota bacterium]